MQTTGTIEPSGSAAPGIIPDPVSVHDAPGASDQRSAGPTPAPEKRPARRARAGFGIARALSVIRGDEYMANAYPPEWVARAGATEGDRPAPATRKD